eukprot:2369513-Amphidinium_carterae.1
MIVQGFSVAKKHYAIGCASSTYVWHMYLEVGTTCLLAGSRVNEIGGMSHFLMLMRVSKLREDEHNVEPTWVQTSDRVVSTSFRPPAGLQAPQETCFAYWQDKLWTSPKAHPSTHNYDVFLGSLRLGGAEEICSRAISVDLSAHALILGE